MERKVKSEQERVVLLEDEIFKSDEVNENELVEYISIPSPGDYSKLQMKRKFLKGS